MVITNNQKGKSSSYEYRELLADEILFERTPVKLSSRLWNVFPNVKPAMTFAPSEVNLRPNFLIESPRVRRSSNKRMFFPLKKSLSKVIVSVPPAIPPSCLATLSSLTTICEYALVIPVLSHNCFEKLSYRALCLAGEEAGIHTNVRFDKRVPKVLSNLFLTLGRRTLSACW